jgi:hypothetical protein
MTSKQLEMAALKIQQSNKEDTLTDLEKGAVELLLRPLLLLLDNTAEGGGSSAGNHDDAQFSFAVLK